MLGNAHVEGTPARRVKIQRRGWRLRGKVLFVVGRHSMTQVPSRVSVPFFSLTLFVSAFLLFSVQPMFAKMVLPFLGGTPSAWNACMLFFQVTLLAGLAVVMLDLGVFAVRSTPTRPAEAALTLPDWLLGLRGDGGDVAEWLVPFRRVAGCGLAQIGTMRRVIR